MIKTLIIFATTGLITSCYSSQIANELLTENGNDGTSLAHNHQVQKVLDGYFPVGSDVKKGLYKLDAQGFNITEYLIDGYREYPDGEFKKYNDDPKIAKRKRSEFEVNSKYR